MVKQLPIVKIYGREYYKDIKLGEYRAVDDPHETLDLYKLLHEPGMEEEVLKEMLSWVNTFCRAPTEEELRQYIDFTMVNYGWPEETTYEMMGQLTMIVIPRFISSMPGYQGKVLLVIGCYPDLYSMFIEEKILDEKENMWKPTGRWIPCQQSEDCRDSDKRILDELEEEAKNDE